MEDRTVATQVTMSFLLHEFIRTVHVQNIYKAKITKYGASSNKGDVKISKWW